MEDHNQSKNRTKSADEDSVVELSAEMALPDQTKHKIIDLTDDIDNPDQKDEPKSTEKPVQEEVVDTSAEPQTDEDTQATTSPEPDIEDIQATSASVPPAAIIEAPTDTIEDEVNAAFDAVAVEEPEQATTEADDLLFDELSDITQEVDAAVGKPETPSTNEDPLPSIDTELPDEDDFSAQAAELDAAMAGEFDAVDAQPPSAVMEDEALEIENTFEENQDDEIIELVEVVDPAELETAEAESTEENDIIELTHIVDKEEIDALEAQEIPDEDDSSLTPEATGDAVPTAAKKSNEEELTLSDVDDGIDFTGEIEAATDTDDIFDTAELDGLFDDEIAEEHLTESLSSPSEETAIETDPIMEDVDGLFDIADDIDDAQMDEEKTSDDIASIPSLEDTDGLFDIEDQIDEKQMPAPVASAPVTPFAEQDQGKEEVIQLADVLSAAKEQLLTAGADSTEPDDAATDQSADLESLDETDKVDSDSADDTHSEDALLEDQKIEAAVEKIIRTKYADKLEQLIASAVEKAVTQEIENIKRTLSDNDDPMA